jgi:predicted alpha/beta superfamily hydrolase
MNSLLPLLAAILALTQTGGAPDPRTVHTLTGDVRTHERFVTRLLPARERTVRVWLPPGYGDPANRERRYPVLYLADGQNVFDGATAYIPGQEWRADEAAQELVTRGEIEPPILVAVDNAGADRVNEYVPAGIPSREDARRNVGGQADLYGRFLTNELKPFIDRTYRTKTGPRDTAVGGSSLGGLLALHLALSRPDVFGAALVVSPSVWWGDRDILKEVAALPKRPPVRLYVDIGTAEAGEGTPQSRQALDDARALRDALRAKGWKPGRDLTYTEAEGARHSEAAWSARFPAMLRFLYRRGN